MTEILTTTIRLLGAIAAAVLIPYLTAKYKLAERKKTITNVETAMIWIRQAVKWAEQVIVGTKKGQERLDQVKKVIKEKAPWLDDETMTILIESAVHEMNSLKDALLK